MSLMSTPERPREGPRECDFYEGSRAQHVFGAHAPVKCVQEARMTKLMAQSRFHTLFARLRGAQEPRILIFLRAPDIDFSQVGRVPTPGEEPPPLKMLEVGPQWRGLGGGYLPRLVTPQGGRRILCRFFCGPLHRMRSGCLPLGTGAACKASPPWREC